MAHYRTDLRAAFKAALQNDAYFAGFTEVGFWAKSVDASTLPIFAVGTPREACRRDGLQTTERMTQVVVMIKRTGGDTLGDVLDEDSAAVEIAVMAALPDGSADLTETTITEDAAGERPVGTLMMTFMVPYFAADPLT